MRRPRWLTPGLLLVATGLMTAFWGMPKPEDFKPEGWATSRKPASVRLAQAAPPSGGQRSPASIQATTDGGRVPPLLSYVRRNFPGEWVANYNDTGLLNGVTGGRIPNGAPDTSHAYALAIELAKLQGVRQEDIDSRNRFTAQSEVQNVYEFQQTYQGYTVFGSSIRLNAAKTDGTVYHVSTSLAEITGTDFALGLTKPEVAATIERLYPGKTIVGMTFVEEGPVLWARTAPQELAWVVSVDFKDEKIDRVRVILGSKTGTIRGEKKELFE